MKLRHIRIGADRVFEKTDNVFFTRCYNNFEFISWYLSRSVRRLNIETKDYSLLYINIHPTEQGCKGVDVWKSLEVSIRFSEEDIRHMYSLHRLDERFEYFLSLYERGYRIAVDEGHTEIPINELLAIHQKFREDGYCNEWLWKKKLLREDDMYLFFNVHFSSFDIRMELTVMDKKKSQIKCKCMIFQCIPYLLFFWDSFRKLFVTETEIILLDFLDHPFMTIDRQKLRNGEICTTLLNEAAIDNMVSWQKEIKDITW